MQDAEPGRHSDTRHGQGRHGHAECVDVDRNVVVVVVCVAENGAAVVGGRLCAVAALCPAVAVVAGAVHGRICAVDTAQAAAAQSARARWQQGPRRQRAPVAPRQQLVRPRRPQAPPLQVGCRKPVQLAPQHAPFTAHAIAPPHTELNYTGKSYIYIIRGSYSQFKIPRLLSIQSELANPADAELKSEASFQRLLASNADLPGAFHPHPRPRRRDRGRFPEAYSEDDDGVESDDDDDDDDLVLASGSNEALPIPRPSTARDEYVMDDILDSPARMDVDMVSCSLSLARSNPSQGSYGSPPVLGSLFAIKGWRQTPPPTAAPSRIAKRKRRSISVIHHLLTLEYDSRRPLRTLSAKASRRISLIYPFPI